MIRRLRVIAPLEDAERLTLLPFLDLLFAAVGVLLLLIFQVLLTERNNRMDPGDVLVICDGPGRLLWVEPASAAPVVLSQGAVIERIRRMHEREQRSIRVVIALNGASIRDARRLRNALEEAERVIPGSHAVGQGSFLSVNVATESRGGGPVPAPLPIAVMLQPLPAGDEYVQGLVDDWLMPTGGGQRAAIGIE